MNRETLHRMTGLLWIEAINSNPNGNPDQDNDPRRRADGFGEISPVSLKHKVRALIADKEGPVWQEISEELGITPKDAGHYDILEQKDTKRTEVNKLTAEEFINRFWDARVFGSTFLEKKNSEDSKNSQIHTGAVQFGMGVSLSPVEVERLTTTKLLPAQDGKGKGMAPLAYRIVPYGLYTMPFFVNATAARRTNCTPLDIELMLHVLPYAYQETASYIRSQVNLVHIYCTEHAKARGCYNDFKIIEALTPTPLHPGEYAHSLQDYDLELVEKRIEQLNRQMEGKVSPVCDLMEQM